MSFASKIDKHFFRKKYAFYLLFLLILLFTICRFFCVHALRAHLCAELDLHLFTVFIQKESVLP
jgi:hypothetical protein